MDKIISKIVVESALTSVSDACVRFMSNLLCELSCAKSGGLQLHTSPQLRVSPGNTDTPGMPDLLYSCGTDFPLGHSAFTMSSGQTFGKEEEAAFLSSPLSGVVTSYFEGHDETADVASS